MLFLFSFQAPTFTNSAKKSGSEAKQIILNGSRIRQAVLPLTITKLLALHHSIQTNKNTTVPINARLQLILFPRGLVRVPTAPSRTWAKDRTISLVVMCSRKMSTPFTSLNLHKQPHFNSGTNIGWVSNPNPRFTNVR